MSSPFQIPLTSPYASSTLHQQFADLHDASRAQAWRHIYFSVNDCSRCGSINRAEEKQPSNPQLRTELRNGIKMVNECIIRIENIIELWADFTETCPKCTLQKKIFVYIDRLGDLYPWEDPESEDPELAPYYDVWRNFESNLTTEQNIFEANILMQLQAARKVRAMLASNSINNFTINTALTSQISDRIP